MSKLLVAYFSASHVTQGVAEKLANTLNCDLFEICPKVPYTPQDLDWTNKKSRSTLEMNDLNCRPEIMNEVNNINQYDIVFVGFPIWWYREPSIIDTFLTSYDFKDKYIIPFATSGGSQMGKTAKRMSELTNTKVNDGKVLSPAVSENELKKWIDQLGV